MRVIADRYRLDVPVARGGQGTLHRATDVATGLAVAVKELARRGRATPARRAWQPLLSLPLHDHLSAPVDVVEAEGQLYVVSPWVEGVPLDVILGGGPLTVSEAITITSDLAIALDHLHRHGVAHGDVTPANVLVRRPPASGAVLVDLAPAVGRGTPGFVAPEVAAGADPDAAADVFALAALFVVLVTGHPPPLPPRDLPHLHEHERRRVHSVLGRGLSSRREDRPSAAELVADLGRENQGYRPDHRSRTPFVGRDQLVRQVLRHLGDQRPVTLVAGGGYGKTRLGLEVARAPEAVMPGGAWVVELADLPPGADVRGAVRRTLGVPDGPSLGRQLGDAFPEGALLVLDNAEHVVDAARQVIDEIRGGAPQLAVLATSRLPLGVGDEVVVDVPALPVPDPDAPDWAIDRSAAVALFLSGVPSGGGDDHVPNAALTDVAGVCRRLGGVPLALELAASRLGPDGPTAGMLLDQLSTHMLDVDHGASVEPRHRTLRAVLDWSFSLLPQELQDAMPRLATFRGAFEPAAATAIAALQHEDLVTLASCGLLFRDGGDPPRYRVPEAVLEYLRERLADVSTAAACAAEEHARWYAAKVVALLHESRRDVAGARWVDANYENVLAALEWMRAHGTADELRQVVISLYGYWQLRGRMRDGATWLDRTVERMDRAPAGIDAEARVELLSYAGSFLLRIGDVSAGETLVRRGVEEARATASPAAQGLALLTYGGLLGTQGRLDEAEVVLEEALTHKRASGDGGGVAAILSNLGVIARRTGRLERAIELLEECADLQRELGNGWGLSAVLNNLANGYREAGRSESARALHEEALALRRGLGDVLGTATSLSNLGDIAADAGDLRTALLHHEQALELRREGGAEFELLDSLAALARLLVRLDDRERALGTAAELASTAAALARQDVVVAACALAAQVTQGAMRQRFEELAATGGVSLDRRDVEAAFEASAPN